MAQTYNAYRPPSRFRSLYLLWVRAESYVKRIPAKRRLVGLLVLVVCALALVLLTLHDDEYNPVEARTAIKPRNDPWKPVRKNKDASQLHLLVTASVGNDDLCKCILTSHLLGYPRPVLLNWGGNDTEVDRVDTALRYLNSRTAADDDDLAIMVDGYDTWFQLPPSVFMRRFKRINAENLHLTEKIIGKKVIRKHRIGQNILFGAQKHCDDKGGTVLNNEPSCWAVPESPLRRDLYGPSTDVFRGESPSKFRPRWLNSGFMAGRVDDMRYFLSVAQKEQERVGNDDNDQLLFAKFFGEQSYFRQVLGERGRTKIQKLMGWGQQKFMQKKGQYTGAPKLADGDPYPEHGIGLDYGLEMAQIARFSEYDGRYLRHSSADALNKQQAGMGVDVSPFRVRAPLPTEFAKAHPPFHLLRKTPEADAPETRLSWADVPLYTNIYTGNVPLTLHLNDAHRGMRTALWHEMWYFKHMRTMLLGRAHSGEIGAFDVDGRFLQYSTICKGTEPEVFRDTDVDLIE